MQVYLYHFETLLYTPVNLSSFLLLHLKGIIDCILQVFKTSSQLC